jgi:hypothetical protein
MPLLAALVVLGWLAAPAAAARRDSLIFSRFDIDPGEWRYFEFPAKQKDVRLEVQFEVLWPKGSEGVRVRLLSEPEFRRFRNRQTHQEIGSTPYQRDGRWRIRLAEPALYALVIEARPQDRQKSRVQFEVTLDSGPEPENLPVKYASPRTRLIVVSVSAAGFLLIVVLWGQALLRAVRHRPPPPPPAPPPMWF